MASNAAETLIGAAVLVAASGFLLYAANTVDVSAGGSGYELVAKFRKAEGLDVGGDVRIAGVKVGSISGMELDTNTYQAKVTFTVEPNVQVPDDSVAKITSASLLGDSFIAIDPGASDLMLEPGEAFEYTQGSISLIDLALKFGGSGSSESN